MTDKQYERIYQNMVIKETDKLLEIWGKNDRVEWSDTAFDVIKDILTERLGEVPGQVNPIFESDEEEIDDYEFSKEELAIIDDDNPPEFYDPFEVLDISYKLKKVANYLAVVVAIYSLLNFGNSRMIVSAYFQTSQNLNLLLINILALFVTILNTAFSVAISYFPIIALAHVLRTLMQMEFNSRPKRG